MDTSEFLNGALSRAAAIREILNNNGVVNELNDEMKIRLIKLISVIEEIISKLNTCGVSQSVAEELFNMLQNWDVSMLVGSTTIIDQFNIYISLLEQSLTGERTQSIVAQVATLLNSQEDVTGLQQIKSNFLEINRQILLGTGGFGAVYQGKYSNFPVAIKVLKVDAPPIHQKAFRKEAHFLQLLRHPGIISYYGCELNTHRVPCHMVLELAICSLFDLIHHERHPHPHDLSQHRVNPSWYFKLTELSRKLDFVLQISEALKFLHEVNVLHRDIKPSNIMITAEGKPKLIDFGLAKGSDYYAASTTNQNLVGTLAYIAPECWREQSSTAYGKPADVYAFAILLNELFTQQIPFQGFECYQLATLVPNQRQRPKVFDWAMMELNRIEQLRASVGSTDVENGNNKRELVDAIQILIVEAWMDNISYRSNFATIVTTLHDLINRLSSQQQNNNSTNHTYPVNRKRTRIEGDSGDDINVVVASNTTKIVVVKEQTTVPDIMALPTNVRKLLSSEKMTIENILQFPLLLLQSPSGETSSHCVHLLRESILNTILTRTTTNRILVLNSGSMNRFGGESRGSGLEESLFAASDYGQHTGAEFYPLTLHELVFTPDVTVSKNMDARKRFFPVAASKEVVVDMMAVPAIPLASRRTANAARGNNDTREDGLYTQEELLQLAKDKLTAFIRYAAINGYQELVLTAWGCGGMRNPPAFIAQLFKQLWLEYRYYFAHWWFAHWEDETTFREFDKVFDCPM